MTFDEFRRELSWLSRHFEKTTSEELSKSLYDELKGFDVRDWVRAVRGIARKPDQRAWPRLGQLKEAVELAYFARHDAEWSREKAREKAQVVALFTEAQKGEAQQKIQAILRAMALPVAADRLAALTRLEGDFRGQAADAGAYDRAACSCEQGLVFVAIARPEFADRVLTVGRCGECPAGRAQPAWMVGLDPETGRPVPR